jgi:hypothetical protein
MKEGHEDRTVWKEREEATKARQHEGRKVRRKDGKEGGKEGRKDTHTNTRIYLY